MTRLVRFSPSIDSNSMQDEFDRLFDTFFPVRNRREGTPAWTPRTDFVETQEGYTLNIEVPGIPKEDLEIDFHDGTLTVSGERTVEERSENEVVLRSERRVGRFSRTFALPHQVNEKKIEAGYVDGVLTVRVPKTEDSKPRRIKIG